MFKNQLGEPKECTAKPEGFVGTVQVPLENENERPKRRLRVTLSWTDGFCTFLGGGFSPTEKKHNFSENRWLGDEHFIYLKSFTFFWGGTC